MNKLIIVEGPQGVGKTTVSNWLRENLVYSNLYRMTGHNDKTIHGLEKSTKMYDALLDYVSKLQGTGVNLIFDRIFITEEVYCRLGYREYDFTDVFWKYIRLLALMDFQIYIINLQCMDKAVLGDRLTRDKKQHLDIEFGIANSIMQQDMYGAILDEISNKNIHRIDIDTSIGDEYWKHIITSNILEVNENV